MAVLSISSYYDCWERSDGKLKQKKYGESADVTFYTKDMLIEFTNTLHAHIQLMHNIEGYNFLRNSSIPLEHKFGFARARSHDVNTLTRFLQVISSIQSVENEQTFREICSFNEEADKIRGRINSTGITVEPKNEDYGKYAIETEAIDELPYSPQNVAKTFLLAAGFEISQSSIINYDEILVWTEFFISNFTENKPEQRRKRRSITLNTFSYGIDNCTRAKRLITGKAVKAPTVTHQCNKLEYRIKLFNDLCEKKLGRSPTKEDLLHVIEMIKANDPNCPKPPRRSQSKSEIFTWIIDNLNTYFVFLDSCD